MGQLGDRHTVRRITLASGRSIEVIRFAETGQEVRQLHVCPACPCELVQPLDWSPASSGRWTLTLECPNCGWLETDTFGPAEVEMLEEQIDHGIAELLADLRRLTTANMTAEIDRFVSALTADQILPEDF
jgi:hypothetical protein